MVAKACSEDPKFELLKMALAMPANVCPGCDAQEKFHPNESD
jgi:hypothetical protein